MLTQFRLDSFDVEPPFSRRLIVEGEAVVGSRGDWKWARVEPSLHAGPHRWLDRTVELTTVAIAPRHAGVRLDAGPWPVHVFVCRAIDPTKVGAPHLEADDLAVEFWAIVTPEADDHVTSSDAD